MTTPSPGRRHRRRCRSRPRSRGRRAYMPIAQSASTAHCLILIFRAAGRPRPPRGFSQGRAPSSTAASTCEARGQSGGWGLRVNKFGESPCYYSLRARYLEPPFGGGGVSSCVRACSCNNHQLLILILIKKNPPPISPRIPSNALSLSHPSPLATLDTTHTSTLDEEAILLFPNPLHDYLIEYDLTL